MRNLGPLRLDLFHRDGLVDAKWLRLFPREFEVLWRLADCAGTPVTKRQLLSDVWRLDSDSESNRVEVHISRIRAKLHVHRLSWLIETVPEAGYRLRLLEPLILGSVPYGSTESLDSYARIGNDAGRPKIVDEPNDLSEE